MGLKSITRFRDADYRNSRTLFLYLGAYIFTYIMIFDIRDSAPELRRITRFHFADSRNFTVFALLRYILYYTRDYEIFSPVLFWKTKMNYKEVLSRFFVKSRIYQTINILIMEVA